MLQSAFSFPSSLAPFAKQPFATQELTRAVRKFLDEELQVEISGKHILLAVSGGADSLALLCLWQWLRPVYEHSISVLHVNHQLRPESEAEAHTLQALCKAWDIPCFIAQESVYDFAKLHKKGIEESARAVRYKLYEEYRQKCHAEWVCLGHHLRDVQEDVLMRLMRGAGWPALGGMTAIDSSRHILRPLLMQEPDQLRQLLVAANMGWAEDASNADTSYLRNRIRHTILPFFHAENPAFAQKISELWHFAHCDAEHWKCTLGKLFQDHNIQCQNDTITLPAKLLQQSDKATRLRAYMHALQCLKEGNNVTELYAEQWKKGGQARAQTLFKLDAALQKGRGDTTFELPGKISAYVKKGAVRFFYTS